MTTHKCDEKSIKAIHILDHMLNDCESSIVVYSVAYGMRQNKNKSK